MSKVSTILDFQLEAIAAVDDCWGLGREGRLLAHVSPDLKRFKELTWGQRVIYGRRTLATFPKEQPLPGRENLLLTHGGLPELPGLVTLSGLSRLEQYLRDSETKRNFVIGGAQVYRQLLPWCVRAHITRLSGSFGADCFLTDLERHPDWRLAESGPVQSWQGQEYVFLTYERRQPL